MINILEEPRDKIYLELIDICSKYCTQFMLVKRDELIINEKYLEKCRELNKFLLEEKRSSEWPGTRLINKEATIFVYKHNKETENILKNSVSGLYEWLQPTLPEDLCFLQENGNVFLTTISHELDSYIKCGKKIEDRVSLIFKKIGVKFCKSDN